MGSIALGLGALIAGLIAIIVAIIVVYLLVKVAKSVLTLIAGLLLGVLALPFILIRHFPILSALLIGVIIYTEYTIIPSIVYAIIVLVRIQSYKCARCNEIAMNRTRYGPREYCESCLVEIHAQEDADEAAGKTVARYISEPPPGVKIKT